MIEQPALIEAMPSVADARQALDFAREQVEEMNEHVRVAKKRPEVARLGWKLILTTVAATIFAPAPSSVDAATLSWTDWSSRRNFAGLVNALLGRT